MIHDPAAALPAAGFFSDRNGQTAGMPAACICAACGSFRGRRFFSAAVGIKMHGIRKNEQNIDIIRKLEKNRENRYINRFATGQSENYYTS